MTTPLIENVSDTALWVATYRAKESKRSDALFRDPLASVLAGEKGTVIANRIDRSRYVDWSVVIRTAIIDRLIQEKIKAGLDLIVNLGAGLDTRPYRLDLPAALTWIEVDFPLIIDLKENKLAAEKPRCKLERMRVDLSDTVASQKCFSEIAARSQNILLLTEGVIPYLTNDQVAELAKNLHAYPSFHYWIAEYFSPHIIRYLHQPHVNKRMGNAPFVFAPDDWDAFFKKYGWDVNETKYLAIESVKLGRAVPSPWWTKILRVFTPKSRLQEFAKFSGFHVFERV